MSQKYCLALDLKDNPEDIAAYDTYHKEVWPEIKQSIREAGVTNMEIYRTGNRLFMIMEVNEGFSFERKAALDNANEKVQQWTKLMWRFLQPLPHTSDQKSWILMERVFGLNDDSQ